MFQMYKGSVLIIIQKGECGMKTALIDVPVLFLFFTRPKTTQKVFDAIKQARPSKLYLYQDGAREGRKDDEERILECRKIVEQIDWNCEVHKKYLTKNQGCDPSEFLSIKWMFETEEYGIVLEDDDVPSQSFFPYCRELLEKYKYDERIQMVCGYNPIDQYEAISEDYCFSKVGSIWGWATWKRVVDTWDPTYSWMDDPKKMKEYLLNYPTHIEREFLKKVCQRHKNSGVAYYETINSSNMMLNHRLAINPRQNMISNIGIDNETTHATNNIKLMPTSTQKLLYKKTYEIDFPIKHPQQVVCNNRFKHEVDRALGHTLDTYIWNHFEYYCRLVKYGGFQMVLQKMKKKMKQ